MIEAFLIPLGLISVAEMGDKTQLSVILMSSKVKNRKKLFIGILLAFMVVNGVGVFLGQWVATVVPETYVRIGSSSLFIIIGLYIFYSSYKGSKKEKGRLSKFFAGNSFYTGFGLIFISEWGDKTQLTSALLATQYNPYLVFGGAITALAIVSSLGLVFGKILSEKVERDLLNKIVGFSFLIIGIIAIILTI